MSADAGGIPLSERDRVRARDLARIKLAATALLLLTAGLFLVARHFEAVHWGWG
jgi:hypothetical protein